MTKLFKMLLLLAAISFSSCKSVEKTFPDKVGGAEADTFAKEVMTAVNTDDWNAIDVVQWTFNGKAKHVWDKKRSLAKVEWKDYTVLLDIGKKEGLVWEKEIQLEGEEKDKLVEKAWHKWANDSYWLNPLAKLFDEGTKRYIVKHKAKEALLITYTSGGVTPGDSYLWILDENKRPTAWKMWVNIIPIKGIKTSWEGWQQLENGAWLSTKHKALGLTLTVGDVKIIDINKKDPFKPLLN